MQLVVVETIVKSMKSKCKRCGKTSEGDYCFAHKPRKPLAARRAPKNSGDMQHLFMEIWATRPHKSEISGTFLGKEPLTVFFHHILPKEKYPQAKYDPENIILLSLDEHTNVESDMYRFELINERRNLLLIKYL